MPYVAGFRLASTTSCAAAETYSECRSGGRLDWTRNVVRTRRSWRPARTRRALRGCSGPSVAARCRCHDSARTHARYAEPRRVGRQTHSENVQLCHPANGAATKFAFIETVAGHENRRGHPCGLMSHVAWGRAHRTHRITPLKVFSGNLRGHVGARGAGVYLTGFHPSPTSCS